jgi:ribosomal protein S6
MLHHYETVFIMTPVLSEDQMMDTVNKFKKILTDNGTEIVHENNWGLRKLAYPIQKKNTGFYYLIEYKTEGELINKLEKSPRGYYGGAIGYIGLNGSLNQAIVIRSFLSREGFLNFQAGAGIVINSSEEGELNEVNNKLDALRTAMEKATKYVKF